MSSPFPGMDPYLENPDLWTGFHHTFLTALQEQLAPAVRPNYFVRVEERVYVTSNDDRAYRFIVADVRIIAAKVPNAPALTAKSSGLAIAEPIPVHEETEREVHEYRLEVLGRIDRSVVTVIELLSPTNKAPNSTGRASFLKKRKEVLSTQANWMEIDLLREGIRTANLAASSHAEYQVYLSRAGNSRSGYVWPVLLMEKLPIVGVALREGEADIPLDLQAALAHVYVVGGYELDLDYSAEPEPPLSPASAEWARRLIAARPT